MEQSAETGAPMIPVVENKQKNGNGLKIATAIACVVAVCGIGFGIYGMIQSSQKDSQISDLKTQINNTTASADGINQSVKNNSFELFSSNNDGNISFSLSGYQEPVGEVDYGWVHIDDEHNMKIIVGQTKTTLLEEKRIVLAYYIKQASYEQDGDMKRFNGYTPYVYYVKDDGSVYRIRVDLDTSIPEKIDNHKDIVSIFSSSNPDSPVTMIDIDGKIYQDVK